MTTSTIATKNTESNIRELFLSQFTITVEQKLLDFCTNEIGLLLSGQWNCNNLLNKAAIIGNPLRLVSLDSSVNSDSTNKLLLNSTGSATVLEQNCTGKYLAIATGSNLSIFDLQKGSILRELHDHDGPINGITWHRDSPWQLATVGADSTLRLWDLRSHPAQISLRRTSKSYSRLEYSPDCNYIGCAGQMVSIFDLNMAQSIVHMACPSPANNICFNPAECLLATSSEDRVVRFWDVDTGECVTQSPAFDSSIGQICFTSDGQFLIVNTRKQISCIHWEPFELCSQLSYPIQMEIPAMANDNSPDSPPFSHSSPQINLLDLRIEGEMLHQLTVVKTDPTKIGTICVASIPIQKLEKCGLNNPAALEEVIPTCPIAKGQIELDEEEEEEVEEEVKQREEDDISPESIATSTTAESMIDSMTAIQQPHKLMQSPNHQFVGGTKKSPFTAPTNRKRPPAGSTIKRGTSSVEIGVDAIASSMSNSSGMKMRQKRQQRQSESSTTPEFKGLIRPNQLPIIQNQQQHPSTSSSGQGSSDSSFSDNNRKTLIRRGSSLNDVNEIITTTKNNNMPISSIAMANAKNRSRSHQAQHIGLSKFTMSNGSTSSSNTSSSTSTIGDSNSRRRTTIQNTTGPANSMEEDIEEFIHFDPKIRSSINKQKKDIAALTANQGRVSGNTTEHIVAEASHFEEPHVFAQLLKDYMRKPRAYSMSLNAAFLHRLNILIGHRNNQYVQFSIDFLDMVTTRFGDCIKHGLASQEYTIGVDVAAEQRFERCMKSRNALFQIHLNESIYKEHMDSKQRTYFSKEILPRINQIIYNESQASYNERANQSSFN